MTDLWSRLLAGADSLGALVPALIAAGLILLTGYFLARQIEKWTDHLLSRMDFNKVADAGGLTEAVDRTGVRLDPAHAIGKLLFWLVMLVVILLSSMALGLDSINQMFGLMLSYIPTLIAGIIIVILGMIVGEFVRALVLASAGGVEGVPTLAKIAKAAIIIVAAFMALQQVGVADEIVTSAFTLILGAVALAAGLAFGLGNRELAGEVTRRWYESGRRKGKKGGEGGEGGEGGNEVARRDTTIPG
jgi:small-conductance mechanosensitive channel